MSFKQIVITFLISLLTSISVLLVGIWAYHNYFATPSFIENEPEFTPREKNIVSASKADDRVDYACSGEAQKCEEGFRQGCIYVTCACEDGFKPHGEVDGCIKNTVERPQYKKAKDDLALTDKGLQYAFAGECAQICRQVGH